MKQNLEQLRLQFKEKLVDGIGTALEAMVVEVPTHSAKYNSLLQFKTRHRKYKSDWLEGLIDQEQANLEFNRISAALLEFIDQLEEADFAEAETTLPVDNRIGKLCFRIPNVMQVEEKSDCSVWIAFDEDTVLKSVQVEAGDELKDLRVSDTMGVELFDDSDEAAFRIKTYDETIQPIEKDLLTHWDFKVTPLKLGTYPLVLRIIVVIEQNGKEMKKTIVLEEEIKIVALENEALTEARELSAKVVENMFVLPFSGDTGSGGAGGGGEVATTAGAAAAAALATTTESTTAATATASSGFVTKLMIAVAALVGIFFVVRQFTGGPTDGEVVTDICSDEAYWQRLQREAQLSSLQAFLEQCPNNPHLAEAKKIINAITESTDDTPELSDQTDTETPQEEEESPTGKNPSNENTLSANITGAPASPPRTDPSPPADPAPEVTDPTPATPTPVSDPPTETNEENTAEKAVPFRNAARKPLHPACAEKALAEQEACTEDAIRQTIRDYIKQSGKQHEGALSVSFVITKEGKVAFAKLNDAENLQLASTVVRSLATLPVFRPGQNANGEAIDVRYFLPVRIRE
ncbi:MAG: hypothetical protein AAFO94_12875 [Bacteroidota bacterium]